MPAETKSRQASSVANVRFVGPMPAQRADGRSLRMAAKACADEPAWSLLKTRHAPLVLLFIDLEPVARSQRSDRGAQRSRRIDHA